MQMSAVDKVQRDGADAIAIPRADGSLLREMDLFLGMIVVVTIVAPWYI